MKQAGAGVDVKGGVQAEAGRQMKLSGLAGWVMSRLRRAQGGRPRMALVERIALGPRQSLALVEADGRRFLVATSAEGGPAFLALDERRRSAVAQKAHVAMRVSW